jgi:hypothetical protein
MEQKEHALVLKKMLDWNVSCVDLRSRAPIKGVISGVVLEVNTKDICEELYQLVGAHPLTHMVDGVRKPTPSILLFSINSLSLLTCFGGFMSYPVIAFVPKPMQCDECK